MREEIDKIYSRKDGRFEIRYHYEYKDNGTSNYKSVYGNSENEVVSNYHKTIDDLISKNDLLIYDKTYIGYDINSWLNNSKIKNKKSTYSNYQYTIKSRIIPNFHSLMSDEIIFLHLPKYIQDKNFELSEEEYMELDELATLMLDIDSNFDKIKEVWDTKPKFRIMSGALN